MYNLFTNTENILKIAERKEYRTTSDKESILNYVTTEVNLAEKYKKETEETTTDTTTEDNTTSDVISATTVTIPHSKLQTVKYEYDEETKTYTRYARGKLQKDYVTGEPVTTKNIIITKCNNYTLTNDTENKGRQGLQNIGTFDGYYSTNGNAIPIKCTKSSRSEQTVYKDLQGNEIDVNDGNTFINICPVDAKITIK